MTDDMNDRREVDIERELERSQTEERRQLIDELDREFQTDEKIVRALSNEDDR